MPTYYKTKETGDLEFVASGNGAGAKASLSSEILTIADAAVGATTIAAKAGKIIVDEGSNSANIDIINTADTVTTVKENGPALITITKDNASTINIYVENDVVNVQNLTGAEITVTVKAVV